MEVTIGGERLGSGNKMQTSLKNFERSTHNLKETFTSSIAPGVLVPFYCNIGLNGDTFEMNLNADCITLPTTGPLFGSFKLQLDMFAVPIRLYQAVLHNNPTEIGLKMNQVKLPKIDIYTTKVLQENINTNEDLPIQIKSNCLLKYLGISGIGLRFDDTEVQGAEQYLHRKFNAVPVLAYYDIFKCYYSNKQEKNAYVITPKLNTPNPNLGIITYTYTGSTAETEDTTGTLQIQLPLVEDNETLESIVIPNIAINPEDVKIHIKTGTGRAYTVGSLAHINPGWQRTIEVRTNLEGNTLITIDDMYCEANPTYEIRLQWAGARPILSQVNLEAFKLSNIDDMRMDILSKNQIGDEFVIKQDLVNEDEDAYLPYKSLVHVIDNGTDITSSANEAPMNGLCVKTYQSDLFNNWVQTEWIDGENGINQITKIDTRQGLQLDALVLQKKTWDMLNRIAISGGTYQDWQEAVYTEKAVRHAETPMWIGGYSDEIVFEQIIQTTPTESEPLGTLGGRGKMIGTKHGGHIKYKVTEPCVIMGIASITPRICYSQGNIWYMTEIDTLDDLHKPNLDGIGFQNLICEQMAWWDAKQLALNGHFTRTSAGKVPAWINYMTSFNKVYGDFADENPNSGKAFMTLQRRYEVGEEGSIKDVTTYIDPQKFNYAFADASLTAQNFWLSIETDVKARRKMSAKIIPNL